MEHEDYLRSLLTVNIGGDEEGDHISSHHSPSQNGNGSAAPYDPIALGKQREKERAYIECYRKQKTLLFIRNSIWMNTVASLFLFDWASSVVLSQCVLLSLFVFGTQSSLIVWAYTRSEVECDILGPEKKRAGMIWRGFLMSAVLSIVVDSMTFASWVSVPIIYPTLPTGLLSISLFQTVRVVVNATALVVSSKILHDLGEVGGGIFMHMFSLPIGWTRAIGDSGVFALRRRPVWTAFEGRGMTLGSRGSSA